MEEDTKRDDGVVGVAPTKKSVPDSNIGKLSPDDLARARFWGHFLMSVGIGILFLIWVARIVLIVDTYERCMIETFVAQIQERQLTKEAAPILVWETRREAVFTVERLAAENTAPSFSTPRGEELYEAASFAKETCDAR